MADIEEVFLFKTFKNFGSIPVFEKKNSLSDLLKERKVIIELLTSWVVTFFASFENYQLKSGKWNREGGMGSDSFEKSKDRRQITCLLRDENTEFFNT